MEVLTDRDLVPLWQELKSLRRQVEESKKEQPLLIKLSKAARIMDCRDKRTFERNYIQTGKIIPVRERDGGEWKVKYSELIDCIQDTSLSQY